METPDRFLIVDDDGMPLAAVDTAHIQADATMLAYSMAMACNDPDQLDSVAAAALARVGVDGFGYVAAGALRILAEHILEPSLQVCARLGCDLRPGLAEATANAVATLGGDAR